MRPICLVGQVIVDVISEPNGKIVRLGGVVHAARALWALGCPYTVCYLGPEYLDKEVASHLTTVLSATSVTKVGSITGSPNVILIEDPRETGDQRYEMLLEHEQRSQFDSKAFLNSIQSSQFSDILIFPGGFNLKTLLRLLSSLKARVHLDAVVGPISNRVLSTLKRPLDTLIISTSSQPFLRSGAAPVKRLLDTTKKSCNTLLLKENRGGARLFQGKKRIPISVGAQPRRIRHSVGVGDCYNAVFIALRRKFSTKVALAYASLVAAEYATIYDSNNFRTLTQDALKISPKEINQMKGTILPWDCRSSFSIYIAAPDFKEVNRKNIEAVYSSLKYHNFDAILPVRENGEIPYNAAASKKRTIAKKDLDLLEKCHLLVAVLEYDDPGTLIEVGIALDQRKPVFIFDPYRRASNLMLTSLPDLVTSNLDELVTEIFRKIAAIHSL